jgi:beta-ureidopropionase / N-carbamoyl-L-amino-acid hydrolase
LSHNEAENVLPEDVRQGTDVLLNAVVSRAGKVE